MFKYLVWISALTIALVAAYFSVTGIATLFSGKFFAVLAMASALEIGKLVAASFLYRYWVETGKLLKTYLMAGVAVLMVITSIGIYGYLSAAYAEVAAVPQNTLNQISAIDSRQATLNGDIERLTSDNTTIDSRRAQAQSGLDNVLSGNTDLSQRSAFANIRTEIEQLDAERRTNNTTISAASTERDSLENVKVLLNSELNINSEIGTFIYIARTLGLPLDTVVKWFVLIIVFVFDPMAISLILAYNSIVVREKKRDTRKEDPATPVVHKSSTNPFKKFDELTKDWTEERKERIQKSVDIELEMLEEEDRDVAPTRPPESPPPDLTDFLEARGILSRHAKKVVEEEIPQEEPVEEPPTPILPGWALISGTPNYDHLPYFHRPGYDWEGRRAEWEKDPRAVTHYNKVINPSPPPPNF